MYFINDKYFSHVTIFVVLSPFRNEVRGEVVCVCGEGGGWGGAICSSYIWALVCMLLFN